MEDSQLSPSRNLDQAGNSSTNIPFDLTLEIVSRLPAKPIIRFQAVSKLWFSTIRSKNFTDSFLTRSKTRPRLFFTFKHFDSRKRFIFSAPERDNNDKSSTVVARHDMAISDVAYIRSLPVNGLFCYTRGDSIAVCNPTTRQIVKLPDVESNGRDVYTRLGYDPVQDQYKVLCVMMFDGHDANQQDIQQEHFVFTLSSQQKEWRKIDITKEEDPYRHMKGGICIDGAIHYGVLYRKIARFDVRTEKIEFIQGPEDFNAISCYSTLINYQGKLACVAFDPYCNTEMGMYILQDVEKQEWSSIITCDVPSEWGDLFEKERSLCTGKIHTGEVMIVLRG
ncbi:F-box-like domain superfamily [Arabidopsis suecica]|uniref:F-box-like domain superfamily n=1 Tax=Arabidopsis suecica TaxID=45249 RepID=A0A8T2DDD7_ARASU|nr:F-box-like domain superfamily [Arabidopsis suecica]